MTRVLVLLALACCLAVGAAAAPAAGSGAAALRSCGDIRGSADAPQDVRVAGVGCRRGKRLAKAHWLQSGRYDRCALAAPSCRLQGFTCRRRFFDNSGTRIRCARGADRVRFLYGT